MLITPKLVWIFQSCDVFCCNETEKEKKNEQYFYEEKTDSAASGIYGNAYGTVYAGEFTVQHCRQLFCGKDQ